MKKILINTVALTFACALTANAAWIIPVGVFVSSQQDATNSAAVNAINGSGLSAESTSGLLAAGPATSWSFAQGNSIQTQNEYITFDLGALYNLSTLHIWQFTRNTFSNEVNRGVQQFDVLVSADNVSFSEVLSNQILNKALDTTPANGTPDGNEPVQSFALVQSGVRYVQLGIDSTFEGSTSDFQGGFGEVRFESIPEPSAALLGGLGMLALLRRRRA